MQITYVGICEKLGFDPLVNPPERKYDGHEDDSQPNPYSVLTLEEKDFLLPYFLGTIDDRKNTR